MRIGCKECAKLILRRCGCDEDCYRGVDIKEIESDLEQCFNDHPEYNGNNYPIHDLAVCMREIGDGIPLPPPAKYCMIFDGGSFVDGIEFDDLEAAKADAIDTLILWMTECCMEYKMDTNPKNWTEKQIEEWDRLYYDCSVEVCEYNHETNEYDIEIWCPSFEDEKEIRWLAYEDLIKEEK